MDESPLRVVTFNIKHGLAASGHLDLRLLGRTCAGFDADVLALQEVDRRAWRTRLADEMAVVARATGLSATFGEAVRRRLIRTYGNALLARGKISDVEVVDLPRPHGGELRVAILATVILDGRDASPLSVAATHLSFRKGVGPVQLATLVEMLELRPPPRVLLGDLNLGPEIVEPALKTAGYEIAPTGATFPASQPRTRIDYVAVAGLTVVGAETPATELSDHRPVVAEIRLPGSSGDV